ncbi:hypothetical protein Dimus_005383, partial [Dionaea muscipula]
PARREGLWLGGRGGTLLLGLLSVMLLMLVGVRKVPKPPCLSSLPKPVPLLLGLCRRKQIASSKLLLFAVVTRSPSDEAYLVLGAPPL